MAQRSFTINLSQTGTGKTATISVSQNQFVPVYTFTSGSTKVSNTTTVDITSTKTTVSGGTTSVGWTSSVSGGGASLVKVTNSSGDAKITISSNPDYTSKSATVTLTQNESNKKITISVTIPAKADDGVFTANPDTISFEPAGGSKTSKITSTSKGQTVGWTVSNKGSFPSWLSVSGEGTGTLTIKVTANS